MNEPKSKPSLRERARASLGATLPRRWERVALGSAFLAACVAALTLLRVAGVLGLASWASAALVTLVLSPAVAWVAVRLWRDRFEPPHDPRGHHAPAMWRVAPSIVAAVLVALLAMFAMYRLVVLFGGVTLTGAKQATTVTDVMQAAIAVMSPVAAMIAAVFLYRRSKVNLADSRRADDAAFQQRFVEASNLLGNGNAAVRVAGVIAMEALARDWETHRQRCVDVLCGYMRVPVEGRALAVPGRFEIADRGENEVRDSLVRALARIYADPYVRRGEPIDLDLQRAAFGDHADFEGATFTGDADFEGATFTGLANFVGASFARRAKFDGATFATVAAFDFAAFISGASFEGATFKGGAYFRGARFPRLAYFADAAFKDGACFDRATFTHSWSFVGATFTGLAYFEGATFASFLQDAFPNRRRSCTLGPLGTDSSLPVEPGEFVDSQGASVGVAVWTHQTAAYDAGQEPTQ